MTRGFWILVFLIFLPGILALHAQPLPIVQEKQAQDGFDVGKSYYDAGQYQLALPLFQKMLSQDPENSNLNFIVGDCMFNLEGYEKDAIPYMQKAVRNIIVDYNNLPQQRRAPVFAFNKLGDLLYQDYNFDEALTNYRVFRTYLDVKKDKALLEDINRKVDIAGNAKRFVENPLKMNLTEIPFVNVISFTDFGARMSADGTTIYFNRKRISSVGNQGNSDIYYMRKVEGKWGRPVRMPFINTEADEEFCWVSKDENEILLSSNREGRSHLYMSVRKGKSQWTLPEALNNNINSKSEETFGFISGDGRVLYFVSNRKGGFGGKDIYRSFKTGNGEWGPAENLGNRINSALDEDTPFLSDDGKTLYFSSKGFETMGGYDVFYCTLTATAAWSDPVNIGYPVNTIGDDLYFNHSSVGTPNYFITRSKSNKEDYSINALNDSETTATITDLKSKETPKEKQRLKLVPKTLKY